jgi:leucyl aminopeptidase
VKQPSALPRIRLGASVPKAAAMVLPIQAGQVPAEFRDAADAGGFSGSAGSACDILGRDGRRLLVGLGAAPDEDGYRRAGALAAARLARVSRTVLDATGLLADHAAAFALGAALRAWRPDGFHTIADPDAPLLAAIDLLSTAPGIEAAWHRAAAVLAGSRLARDLVTEPSATLTPQGFIDRLAPLQKAGVQISVLRRRDLEREGMGCLLAVGRGSEHRPRLVILRLPGAIEAPPIAFVGKGITFDTGGICIKPHDRMWEMRADMAGAAACAGAMLTLALRGSPAPAIAVLALAENAIGADSYRPGDVLTSFSGKTVEVVDTDAEGRLVLADALAYTVQRLRPAAIIDLATLTGSIVTALGHEMAGLFTNDPALAAHVAAAGAQTGEPAWRMPISAAHRSDLDSDIADLRHCTSGRLQPDACHAAAFLQEFVGDTAWVHLDIAGVESREDEDDVHAKGATGYGVRLLDRLVSLRFEDPHRA